MRRALVAAVGVGAASIAVGGACSLGLDASKIDGGARDADVVSTEDAPVTPVTDAADAAPPAEASAPECVHDTDCTSTSACRVGACTAGACVFSVCPTSACQGSSCSATGTCSAPATYGFHAATIPITAGTVGCNGNANACLAAAYPFVFVGTTVGVVAFAVNDPSNTSPPMLPVLGVPFVPTSMTAMGSRVYFLGGVAGSGPVWRAQLAWIDVPTDPLATSLQARSAFDTLTAPAINAAWAATDGSVILADQDATHFFPLATIKAPLKDGDALAFFPSPGVPPNALPVVPSGDRVVVARSTNDGTVFQTLFSFETAAATGNAQNAGEQSTLTTMGPTAAQSAYAQGADGSVIWSTASVVLDDGGVPSLATARFAWLVGGTSATTFDPTAHLDVEVYAPSMPMGTPIAGPVAWIDANTALVLASARELPTETSVQVAVKTPTPALAAGRRTIIPAGVGSVGAAASSGFGYVLEADPPATALPAGSLELHVFAPACAQ